MDGRQGAAMTTIKLKKDLLQKVERVAAAAGYSSPEEFIEHVLEREIAKLEEAQADEEIARRLKGLGYID
jgi:metal-responsive CopG/Arc/MetJ family transcriptional regulator